MVSAFFNMSGSIYAHLPRIVGVVGAGQMGSGALYALAEDSNMAIIVCAILTCRNMWPYCSQGPERNLVGSQIRYHRKGLDTDQTLI